MLTIVDNKNWKQGGVPLGMPNGGTGCVGIPTTDTTPQVPIQVGDGVNAQATFWGSIAFAEYPLWDIDTTYPVNLPVSYFDGLIYFSKQAGNIGNQPNISSTWWTGYTPQTLMKKIFDLLTGQ